MNYKVIKEKKKLFIDNQTLFKDLELPLLLILIEHLVNNIKLIIKDMELCESEVPNCSKLKVLQFAANKGATSEQYADLIEVFKKFKEGTGEKKLYYLYKNIRSLYDKDVEFYRTIMSENVDISDNNDTYMNVISKITRKHVEDVCERIQKDFDNYEHYYGNKEKSFVEQLNKENGLIRG